MNFYNGK